VEKYGRGRTVVQEILNELKDEMVVANPERGRWEILTPPASKAEED
jgi:hypothetical protein